MSKGKVRSSKSRCAKDGSARSNETNVTSGMIGGIAGGAVGTVASVAIGTSVATALAAASVPMVVGAAALSVPILGGIRVGSLIGSLFSRHKKDD